MGKKAALSPWQKETEVWNWNPWVPMVLAISQLYAFVKPLVCQLFICR